MKRGFAILLATLAVLALTGTMALAVTRPSPGPWIESVGRAAQL